MNDQEADLVAQFSSITGANPSVAQNALQASDWDLQGAIGLFYAAADEPTDHSEASPPPQSVPSSSAAGPAAHNSSVAPSGRTQGSSRPKQMTLQDLHRGNDDDDGDDEDKPQDMFAGGEKSGLAVQNPNSGSGNNPIDHFRNIMNQAKANRERPESEGEEAESGRATHFTGRAQTLGGEDVESRVINDAHSQRSQRQQPARVTRTLHLWADGVSIDDGPLFRFDDPANQDMMAQINQGRAPLSLLDVQPNQEVDLNLVPHKDENYVAPKKAYKPFGGQGQRLGSPTPGVGSSTSATAATSPAPSQARSAEKSAAVEVDEAAPTITIQIRLGDGTRLQSRFNTTHTIGDVYGFVDQASPASRQRQYALMTTFPSKELDDKALVLGEMSDFKRGGVVVQKWK